MQDFERRVEMENAKASTETETIINSHRRKMDQRTRMVIISVVIVERHTRVSVASLLKEQRLIKILLQERIGWPRRLLETASRLWLRLNPRKISEKEKNDVIVGTVVVQSHLQVMVNHGGAVCLEQNRYICYRLQVSAQLILISNSNQKTSNATRSKLESGPSSRASTEDAESMSSRVAIEWQPQLS